MVKVIRRRPQIASVQEEYEEVWMDDQDGLQVGEYQRDEAADPAVNAVNILAKGEIKGAKVNHVTC